MMRPEGVLPDERDDEGDLRAQGGDVTGDMIGLRDDSEWEISAGTLAGSILVSSVAVKSLVI